MLDRDGEVADRVMLDGEQPTNVAFSVDGTKLLVTEVSKGQVEVLPAPCAGLSLHYPKVGSSATDPPDAIMRIVRAFKPAGSSGRGRDRSALHGFGEQPGSSGFREKPGARKPRARIPDAEAGWPSHSILTPGYIATAWAASAQG